MKKIIAISMLTSILLSNEVSLEPIVVTATKVSQSIKDITSSTQVITKEDIEEKRYTSVLDALNSLAGVGYTTPEKPNNILKILISNTIK